MFGGTNFFFGVFLQDSLLFSLLFIFLLLILLCLNTHLLVGNGELFLGRLYYSFWGLRLGSLQRGFIIGGLVRLRGIQRMIWKGVCFRLILRQLQALRVGRNFSCVSGLGVYAYFLSFL